MENVLVLGEGAREHCICEALIKSKDVKEVFVFPGNDGMVSKNITKININNTFESILEFCIQKEIKYVFPSTEKYLVDGIVDFLKKNGIKCFGPCKKNAFIEGCKIFSKNLMTDMKIPTPYYQCFNDIEKAKEFIFSKKDNNFVIKNPNLAGGKGVFIPENKDQAIMILKDLFENNKDIIIEEKINGQEVSILGFCNGKEIKLMPQTQDYKKLFDNERGPNTGGMGSFGPVEILNQEEINYIEKKMNEVVKILNYKGVLYAGIMKTKIGVYFLEFNCRFGDPEAQVLLNLLSSDFFEICKKCIYEKSVDPEWKKGYCLNLVMSHRDYPYSKTKESFEVKLSNINSSIKLYSGNLQIKQKRYFSNGGRILNLLSTGENPCEIFTSVYRESRNLEYKNKYFRKDIGIPLVNKTSTKKIKVCILGSTMGTCTQKLVQKCQNLNISIEVIISNKKNSYILERAKEANISFFYLNSSKFKNREEYDKKLVDILKIFDVDLVILAGYMKILTKKFIESYENRIINVHPSLLPDYKGLMDMDVHRKVLKDGEKISGCTIHYVNEEVDSGDIILQKQYFIKKNETSETLKKEIQKLESDAIIEAINIFRERKKDYKSSGVDIEEGNKVVDMIKSLTPQLKKDIGHFGCIYEINGIKLAASTDGVGSKLEIALGMKKYETIGIDLVAMVVNDLYCCGAKPLFFLDYLAVDKLDQEKCEKLIRGINNGCEISGCKLIGGETAEMPSLYYKDKFDMAGFGVGLVETTLPRKINKGDEIYGMKSYGIHSNGFSLVRELLKSSNYNIEEILTPTRIYYEIPNLIKEYGEKLRGVCHITGGGITENLPRILEKDLTFQLKEWEFPPIFKWIQKESKMSKEEMLQVYNCGFGMILVFEKDTQIKEKEFEYLGKIV